MTLRCGVKFCLQRTTRRCLLPEMHRQLRYQTLMIRHLFLARAARRLTRRNGARYVKEMGTMLLRALLKMRFDVDAQMIPPEFGLKRCIFCESFFYFISTWSSPYDHHLGN